MEDSALRELMVMLVNAKLVGLEHIVIHVRLKKKWLCSDVNG